MKPRLHSLLLLLLGLGLLYGAGRQQERLLDQRLALGLDVAPPLESSSPLVQVVTVALGGFRGIIADILWVRSSRLQEEGRYFELVQLANWITILEPRIPEVWTFHAWNMSYNISVLFSSPEDRWRWVRNGFVLLRDDALRHNPTSADLHWQLGWIFQHKMGQDLDQMHFYYKQWWALEMMQLFNGSHPDYEAIRQAPANEKELRALPGLPALLDRLKALGINPLRFEDYASGANALTARETVEGGGEPANHLRNYLRTRHMIDSYKLDPERMEEIDTKYGPFDWRLPQAHSAYWAYRGLAHAEGFDALRLRRMIFQSMADAFRRGRLIMNPRANRIVLAPRLELLDRTLAAYEDGLAEKRNIDSVKTGHMNFLIDAVMLHYQYGHEKKALEIFRQLHERYPGPKTTQGFEAFIVATYTQFGPDELSYEEALSQVESAWYQFFYWQAVEEDELAERHLLMARAVYKAYMDNRTNPEFMDRTGLPPIEEIQKSARQRLQQDFQPPPPPPETTPPLRP